MVLSATVYGIVFIAFAKNFRCVEAAGDCACPTGEAMHVLDGNHLTCAATGPRCEDKTRLNAPNAMYCRSDRNCPGGPPPSADYYAGFPCKGCTQWCTEECGRDPKCVGLTLNGDSCWRSEHACRDDQLTPPTWAYYCVKVCEVPTVEYGKVQRLPDEFSYVAPKFVPVSGKIRVVCDEGFVVRGPTTFVCSNDERWEPVARRRSRNKSRQPNRCPRPMKFRMSRCVSDRL